MHGGMARFLYIDVPAQSLSEMVTVESTIRAYLNYREQEKKDENVWPEPKQMKTTERIEKNPRRKI